MMEFKKKLYLHIGLPKTGTTSLQNFLHLNSKNILEKGVVYPNLAVGPNSLYSPETSNDSRNGNAYSLSYNYLEDKSITICNEKGISIEGHLGNILRNEDRNVLLSSEWLVTLTTPIVKELKKISESLGYSIKIICYIRRQDLLLESTYNQRIKIRGENLSFDKFIFFQDFHNNVLKFANIFGDDSILIRCFEKQQMIGGDLFLDFLGCIGIEIDDISEFIVPEKSINASISCAQINLLKGLTQAGFGPSLERNLLIKCFENIQEETVDSIKPTWFSPAQRLDFMKKNEETNSKFAKRFLNREDGKLFFEPLPSIDSAWRDARKARVSIGYLNKIIDKLRGISGNDGMGKLIMLLDVYKSALIEEE